MSAIDKTQAHQISRLHLNTNKIPLKETILRLGEQKNIVLIRNDLIEKIKSSNCTGPEFMEIADYGREYRPIEPNKLPKAYL